MWDPLLAVGNPQNARIVSHVRIIPLGADSHLTLKLVILIFEPLLRASSKYTDRAFLMNPALEAHEPLRCVRLCPCSLDPCFRLLALPLFRFLLGSHHVENVATVLYLHANARFVHEALIRLCLLHDQRG